MPINCESIVDWARAWAQEDKLPFHAALMDAPYHLTSITERFGAEDAAPAQHGKDGAFGRVSKGFMGKSWDGGDVAFQVVTWRAVYDVLMPGAFMFVFGGSRTVHRMAVAIEDAGFRIHPMLVHLQSQGFPKAQRIDTQIDKAAGAEREVVATVKDDKTQVGSIYNYATDRPQDARSITAPATPLAQQWEGHRYGGQALSPSAEFIVCAQRPYEGRPVDNIVATGAGSLNIEAGRIGTEQTTTTIKDFSQAWGNQFGKPGISYPKQGEKLNPPGRWPSNVALSHSPDCTPSQCADGCAVARLNNERTVAQGDILLYNTSNELYKGNDKCCVIASIAVRNLTLELLMSNAGMAASAVENVATLPVALQQEKKTPLGERKPKMADGIDCGEKQTAGQPTSNLKTDGCGSKHTEQYQTDTTSTTSTLITQITTCPICNSCHQVNTTVYTNEYGKITSLTTTVQSLENVSDVKNINPLPDIQGEPLEHMTGIADNAKQSINVNGEPITRNIIASICNSGEPKTKTTIRDDEPSNNCARFFHNSDYYLEAAERIAAADPMLYTAKADKWQREAGLIAREPVTVNDGRDTPIDNAYQRGETMRVNTHPTIKPLSLCHWLASLLLPPDAYAPRRLLVPFSGSGSEMIGALLAGWEQVQGVEIEQEYIECPISIEEQVESSLVLEESREV